MTAGLVFLPDRTSVEAAFLRGMSEGYRGVSLMVKPSRIRMLIAFALPRM
jgi:hypothetical protein